ncbi:carbon-nitrogen family hydrolase [Macrococcoides canis]|uniref:carbon-nitrogen family hydrolase n=1 Tax=Macrococcoides canis TaxID=1855823 RepID=UPI002F42CCDA
MMKCAIYQMEIIPGSPEENIEKIRRWISGLDESIEIVVLPEMWNTSYVLDELNEIADEDGSREIHALQEMAKRFHVHIIGGSIAVKSQERIFNRNVVINRDGEVVHQYDKVHLVPMLDEPKYLTAGNHIQSFTLDGIKMGVIICYDLRFPEISRKLALEGIEVLFVVAEWPASRMDAFNKLLYARAIENQVYVIACNNIGYCREEKFGGQSKVINPLGTLVESLETDETTLTISVDLDYSKEVKSSIPVMDSRRPELY